MMHPEIEDDCFEVKCEWWPYRVTSTGFEHQERREQRWWGRNANHALERAAVHNPLLFEGMDFVKAEVES